MKLPINWLKEFIDVDSSLEDLADKLLRLGIEVERIEKSSTLKGIKVGKVISVKKHPSADKLTICMVDVGEGSPKQIICGASNVKEGIKVPVILPGNILPCGLKIEKRPLRGIKSEGMICSKEELELEDNSDGIWILPDKCEVGRELSEEIETDDAVIDIKVTPNRGDCLSVLGIARELAALTLNPAPTLRRDDSGCASKKLKLPSTVLKETKDKTSDQVKIIVEDPDLCPRYTARMVANIKMGNSPCWMRRRLILAGVRPINNIVDITNYVLLETGQPLHAFDYEKLSDKKIIVRRARNKEKLLCLDEIQRGLSSDNLVIADSKKTVALAGVMGGEETGVGKNTKTVVIESANFSPVSIRKTSKHLNVASESSYRFERGVDLEGTLFAADRACYLIQELSGGSVLSGAIDIKGKIAKKMVTLNPNEIERVLGLKIPSYNKILISLGFETKKDGDKLQVQVPSWRNDIKEEIDLIEEIARVNNYDLIPLSLPLGKIPSLKEDNKAKIIKKCRNILNGLSLNEVVNYSFISADLLKKSSASITDDAIKIDNPISADFEILRTSLIPSLLQTAQENISKGVKNLKIFELRSIYAYKKGKIPKENIHLGILLTGDWQSPDWFAGGIKSSFYVLKGVIGKLFSELGIEFCLEQDKCWFFNGVLSFSLLNSKNEIGILGGIDSKITENFSIKENIYVAEIDLESLIPSVQLAKKIKALPKYPPTTRDFSLLVPDTVSSEKIEKIMAEEAKELLEEIKLFDYYKGKQVPDGFKSMSYSLIFRSGEKTLTDTEVSNLQDRVIKKLEAIGLKLRR